jgi:hypothetical protein
MPVTTLQSNLVPVKLSADAGVTKKAVVCKKSWTFNGTTPVNEDETDCGPHIGLGANKWSIDVEGIVNTTPTGATEMSAEDLLGFWNSQTSLLIYLDYPSGAGTDLYASGSIYITNFQITNQVGSLITFSATFSGNGALDVTP